MFLSKMNQITELLHCNNILMEQNLEKFKDGLREQFEFEFRYQEIVSLHDEFYFQVI